MPVGKQELGKREDWQQVHLGYNPNSDPYKVVTLAKLLKASKSHFHHQQNGDNAIYCIGLGGEFSEVTSTNGPA